VLKKRVLKEQAPTVNLKQSTPASPFRGVKASKVKAILYFRIQDFSLACG
jgi:hypothetical protein